MSAPAGDYSYRLLHLPVTYMLDSQTGQNVPTNTPAGYLWCAIDETNARQTTEFGGPQTGADASIRIRNYPTINPNDLLRDESGGVTYIVEAARFGDTEVIADCHRNDVLVDYREEE